MLEILLWKINLVYEAHNHLLQGWQIIERVGMISNPRRLISDFVGVATLSGFSINKRDITHEVLCAPHVPTQLPKGKQAVYVFSTSTPSPIVLKVGKVGPRSNARFQSQHYNPRSAKGNLAKSLLEHQDLWKQLGIRVLDEASVGEWITTHTDRDHFFLTASQERPLLNLLEVFLQCRLRPVFEG